MTRIDYSHNPTLTRVVETLVDSAIMLEQMSIRSQANGGCLDKMLTPPPPKLPDEMGGKSDFLAIFAFKSVSKLIFAPARFT